MNVVVTGAGRGIGRAVALAFGERGHRVLINFKERRADADETVRLLREKGAEAAPFAADVADPAQARRLVEAAVEKWGALHGLVNNAGITRDKTLLKMTEAEWREVIDVNLSGAFWCLQAAARVLSKNKDGFILNIGSILGARGGFGCANYAAAKAGLVALTKSAARELGRFNVRVNAVLPGFHPTEMGRAVLAAREEALRAEHALGRFTDLVELARFVVQVAEQTSASGQVFNFDSRVL